ncbi:MAG: peptidylprolyl isomerase [Thermodesulfobacteriota bacterium]
MKRAIFCLFTISLLVVLHLTSAHASEPERQEPAGTEVAATVNGVPIPEKLLAAEINKQLQKYARYGMRQATPELTATLRQQALDRLIDQELLRQASSVMVIPDAEEQARRKLAAMQAGFRSPEQFDHYLASRNLTPAKIIDTYRSQLQMDAYLASLGLDVKPSEEQITAYYEGAKENFKREESVKARHILIVAPPDASQEVKEQARRQAEELLGQLVQDIHQFSRLAAGFSGCARSKDQGGDLGYISRGFMPPEFDAAAFTLSPGEMSGIVASKYGYHIIQVVDKRPAGYAPLAEVHDFISKYLQGDMVAKKKALHVEEIRKQAAIKVMLN